ncbi:MAG: TonB family protein [Bacteroidaceae bacterium]|nr:TonB family protein [Bacteroidaceae bacterium]
MNKYLLLLIFALVLPLTAQAQFFDFGFGDPFDDFFGPRRVEQQQQPVEKAQFKGGKEGMNAFIEKNYKNPSPRVQGLEGEILVYCLISEKGKVEEAKVSRALSPAYDKEAVRVVKKMKFKPAKQGKKKVKSRYQISFPIRKGRLSFNTLPTVDV